MGQPPVELPPPALPLTVEPKPDFPVEPNPFFNGARDPTVAPAGARCATSEWAAEPGAAKPPEVTGAQELTRVLFQRDEANSTGPSHSAEL